MLYAPAVDAEQNRVGQREQALKRAAYCPQTGKAIRIISAQSRLGVMAEQLRGGLGGARQKRTPCAPEAHVELQRPDVIQATKFDKHPSLLWRERRLIRRRGPQSEGTDQCLQTVDPQPSLSLYLRSGYSPFAYRRHQHRVEDRTLGIPTLDRTLDHRLRDPNRPQRTNNLALGQCWI